MTYTEAIALAEARAQESEANLIANKLVGTTRPDTTTTCAVRIMKNSTPTPVISVTVTLRAAGADIAVHRMTAPNGWPAPPADPTFEACKAASLAVLARHPGKVGAAARVQAATTIDDLLYTPERLLADKKADERAVVRTVSKLSIRRKLRLINKEAEFDAMLDLVPHARTDWTDAQEISTDDPLFVDNKAAIMAFLEITEDQFYDLLK